MPRDKQNTTSGQKNTFVSDKLSYSKLLSKLKYADAHHEHFSMMGEETLTYPEYYAVKDIVKRHHGRIFVHEANVDTITIEIEID